MKNTPQELDDTLTDLWEELDLREQYLVSADEFDVHTQGRKNNIVGRIRALEENAKEIKERFADKPNVYTNFRKRAEEIKEEIQELT